MKLIISKLFGRANTYRLLITRFISQLIRFAFLELYAFLPDFAEISELHCCELQIMVVERHPVVVLVENKAPRPESITSASPSVPAKWLRRSRLSCVERTTGRRIVNINPKKLDPDKSDSISWE